MKENQITLLDRQLSRRKLLKATASVAGGSVAAAFMGGCSTEGESRSSSGLPETYEARLLRYKKEIPLFDAELARVDQVMVSLLGEIEASDSPFKTQLSSPIHFWQENQANPYRNNTILLLLDLEKRGKQAMITSGIFTPEKQNYFNVSKLSGGRNKDLAGAYDPESRTVLLGENFDTKNPYDVMVLYHEIIHAKQDYDLRMLFSSTPEGERLYSSFINKSVGESRSIGKLEHEAYVFEVMLFDVLTKGEFKNAVSSGDMSAFNKKWGIPEKQSVNMRTLADIAKVIYSTNSTVDNYQRPYRAYINGIYRNRGTVVYEVTPDNRIVKAGE